MGWYDDALLVRQPCAIEADLAQLRIANTRLVHASRELLGGLVDIELLEREKVVGRVRVRAPPEREKRDSASPSPGLGALALFSRSA